MFEEELTRKWRLLISRLYLEYAQSCRHDKQYGVMRVTEFKRCLSQVAYAAERPSPLYL